MCQALMSYQLSAISYQLSAISYQLSAISFFIHIEIFRSMKGFVFSYVNFKFKAAKTYRTRKFSVIDIGPPIIDSPPVFSFSELVPRSEKEI